MAEDKKNKAEEEEKDEEEQPRERVDPRLLGYIFEPTDERLPELTDVPLNQVNSLTWMATFEEATNDLAARIRYVRTPVEERTRVYKPKLLSETWRRNYYKHRRSLGGFGLMRATQLANKQLETQVGEGGMPDILDYR